MTKIVLWHGSEKEKEALKKAGYDKLPKLEGTTGRFEANEPAFLVARKLFDAGANVMIARTRETKHKDPKGPLVNAQVIEGVIVGVADDLFKQR